MSSLEEILLPDIGDFSGVEIIEILVAPGDRIEAEQSILTLESDKATIEVPAPLGGLVQEVLVKTGDRVSQGDRLMRVETSGSNQTRNETSPVVGVASAASAESAAEAAPTNMTGATPEPESRSEPAAESEPPRRAPGETERRQAPVRPRPEDMTAIARGRKAHASPAVRRFARELGVDLARVKGSGPKGRIVKDDVQGYVKQTLAQGGSAAIEPGTAGVFQLPSTPEVDFSRFGPTEIRELPRIRKLSGRHLHRCWIGIPHVTQFDEADITDLEAFRQTQKDDSAKAGVKLTLLPFLLKAVATALARMPVLKASLTPDGESLVHKHYTHIGVAVDTPNGLVVPVVRDVDRKGLHQLATELADLSAKARDGKLLPGDMQGGCFSISSLGGVGGTAFTPIVNAPEVAILGVSRAEMKPVWNGREFVPRRMLPLSLSYDHRVVDGADGARFTSLLRELLGDIRRLLI
ncbi:dihydrolipoyllysine-residue acetyltransferase [Allochromatium vinosum]|uniref:Acetyltransferase component of pyruvate dehydrogenase complex n=1 Tax=Allochromatium vinosum (strain ATCC 17899 / DSM 180 / NBRC 103801 / NCIMB 10441 / D) TaxID=572477 RepID=D3RQE6_ALLVD|nr:dihydrolipoyllysine-residue acetyltransferase [Allochromatium vinosum]ADC61751.1 pyruvate dehydrogenase complex dihydrolipoamide acetyltransferase [Allochromatium vinosum DSM 180]